MRVSIAVSKRDLTRRNKTPIIIKNLHARTQQYFVRSSSVTKAKRRGKKRIFLISLLINGRLMLRKYAPHRPSAAIWRTNVPQYRKCEKRTLLSRPLATFWLFHFSNCDVLRRPFLAFCQLRPLPTAAPALRPRSGSIWQRRHWNEFFFFILYFFCIFFIDISWV